MKKLISIIVILALMGVMGYQYFSRSVHTCEYVIEPVIPDRKFYNVDTLDQYTIEEHMNMIKGPENIQKAIRDYRLNDLYSKATNLLQEEIASIIEVDQLSTTNKIAVKVGADSEVRAQQIAYAIVCSYSRLLDEKKDLQADEIREKYKTETENQKRKVALARANLSQTSNKFGVTFVDPNPRNNNRPLYSTEPYKAPKEKLTPEQLTRYSIAEDNYLAELKALEKSQTEEFNRTIHKGPMDPLLFHNYAASEEVSNFMHKRYYSQKQ